MKKTLGEKIAENRRRLGLTQENLSEKLGVSRQTGSIAGLCCVAITVLSVFLLILPAVPLPSACGAERAVRMVLVALEFYLEAGAWTCDSCDFTIRSQFS